MLACFFEINLYNCSRKLRHIIFTYNISFKQHSKTMTWVYLIILILGTKNENEVLKVRYLYVLQVRFQCWKVQGQTSYSFTYVPLFSHKQRSKLLRLHSIDLKVCFPFGSMSTLVELILCLLSSFWCVE